LAARLLASHQTKKPYWWPGCLATGDANLTEEQDILFLATSNAHRDFFMRYMRGKSEVEKDSTLRLNAGVNMCNRPEQVTDLKN